MKRRARRTLERGSALVEFALTLPGWALFIAALVAVTLSIHMRLAAVTAAYDCAMLASQTPNVFGAGGDAVVMPDAIASLYGVSFQFETGHVSRCRVGFADNFLTFVFGPDWRHEYNVLDQPYASRWP